MIGLLMMLAANAAEVSPAYSSCLARARGPVQANICAQAELVTQDARLNDAYKELMQEWTPNPPRRTALRDAERAWIKKRDARCTVGRSSVNATCLLRMTVERADLLESKGHL